MWNRNDIKYFRRALLEWYESNKRDFPWRKPEISDYELILSEILLQRTKAETVAKYYDTFFNKYPDWETLATATPGDLEEILKPLGLFKHRSKRIYNIIQEYKEKRGILPKDKNELRDSNLSTLYISNAYELFVLNHRAALLDVNMSRVLSRVFYPQEKKDVRNDKIIQDLARDVINVNDCKTLNWAILDFAASICKAKNPKCFDCKLSRKCRYFNLLNANELTDEPRVNTKDANLP